MLVVFHGELCVKQSILNLKFVIISYDYVFASFVKYVCHTSSYFRPPMMESMDDSVNSSKNRRRLNTFVGKIRRRQHEKEYMSHRHVSFFQFVDNFHVAGIHMSPNMGSLILNKDPLKRLFCIIFYLLLLTTLLSIDNILEFIIFQRGFNKHYQRLNICGRSAYQWLGGSPSVISHLKIAFPQFNLRCKFWGINKHFEIQNIVTREKSCNKHRLHIAFFCNSAFMAILL
uniref:Transmembrane protein n=1 Tax=Heterorhabditis bacteriophora TaxID=37862 RepID=A0A1I7WHW5_HETBA